MPENSVVTINRNPFGRYSIARRIASHAPCAWCGRDARFQYGQADDDKHAPSFQPRTFCNVGCARAFYGEEALS